MSALEQALCALRDERAARNAPATPAFLTQFEALRQYQAERIAARHRERAQRNNGLALLEFLIRSFYLEADWSELTDKPHKITGRIDRIIGDQRPLVIAARLQASADALDAATARALLEHAGDPRAITPRRYVHAVRTVGRRAERRRQIDWTVELVALLAGYADNRAAHWGFKLAGGPARALGMGATYGLLAEGFAAMRATQNLESVMRDAVAAQRQLLDRLLPP